MSFKYVPIRKGNDDRLVYVCSLINLIAFDTDNYCKYVVNKIGKDKLQEFFLDASDLIFCDLELVEEDCIKDFQINKGSFKRNGKPKFNEMADVYSRLIYDLVQEGVYSNYIDSLMNVFNSKIGDLLEDYDNCLYWQFPEIIYHCYIENSIEDFLQDFGY